MNHSDSQRLVTMLESFGHVLALHMSDADIIILNTCQIKQHAEDKALGQFKAFSGLRKIKPRIIGIMGCMTRMTSTRQDPKEEQEFHLKKYKEFDFTLQTKDLAKLPGILRSLNPEAATMDRGTSYFDLQPTTQNKFQVMVPISNGCNKFCAYCVVPFARGKEVYRDPDQIIEEIRGLVEEGAKEVTLLGQNVNSYYPECGTTFAGLLERVCEEFPQVPIIRFTSPYPTEFKDDVIQVMVRYPQISRCLHMPLQSGSNKILKVMNRRYSREEFMELIKHIKDQLPDATFTTDIIVGFSGETQEDFEETIDVYEEVRFELAYVSPYSRRRGTFAEKMEDDVSKEEKHMRFAVLQELQEKIAHENNQRYKGTVQDVIVEKVEELGVLGRSHDGKLVQAQVENERGIVKGDIVKVRITEPKIWVLEGVVEEGR